MKSYVIHHVAVVVVEHLNLTNHPAIYSVGAYFDHPSLYGLVEPLVKAEGYLEDLNPEELAERNIVAALGRMAVMTLVGRFDCKVDTHFLPDPGILSDFAVSIHSISCLLEVAGLVVDPWNPAYIHQTRPRSALVCLSSRGLLKAVMTEAVREIADWQVYCSRGSIDGGSRGLFFGQRDDLMSTSLRKEKDDTMKVLAVLIHRESACLLAARSCPTTTDKTLDGQEDTDYYYSDFGLVVAAFLVRILRGSGEVEKQASGEDLYLVELDLGRIRIGSFVH